MILGKVVDSIIASDKHPALQHSKMLWVQPVTHDGADNGDGFIALDAIGVGPGDLVIVCNEGSGCRQIFDAGDFVGTFPVNHVIAGFVD